MEQKISSWLDADFLKKCLQQEEGYKEIIITHFNASRAVPEGNNYGSCLLRVNINYKKESGDDTEDSLSLIVKQQLTEGAVSELFPDVTSNKEVLFYNEFLPQAKHILKYNFAPKSLYSPISSVVVLEDLKEKGFHMADRVKQLDFEHCRLYLTATASFHATSIAIHKQNPSLINTIGIQQLYLNETKSSYTMELQTKRAMECLADHISNSKHAKLVRDNTDALWNMLVEAHKPCEGLHTLNQGDPWTTNMMFRYDSSGNVSDIKLLDFQCLMYTSPVHDIVFFIWSSAQHSVRRHRLDELYHIYLEALNDNLKKLNFTTLTCEEFMEDIKRMAPLALYLAGLTCIILFPQPCDNETMFSKELLESEDISKNPFKPLYTKSFCQDHLPQLLEELEITGVFDYLDNKK